MDNTERHLFVQIVRGYIECLERLSELEPDKAPRYAVMIYDLEKVKNALIKEEEKE